MAFGYTQNWTSCSGGARDGMSCTNTRKETTGTYPDRTKPTPTPHGEITIAPSAGIEVAPVTEAPLVTSEAVDAPVATDSGAIMVFAIEDERP